MSKPHFQKLAKWYKAKIQKKKTSRQDFYNLQVKKEINKVLGHIAKKYALCYFQLIVKYRVVESNLAKIKIIETP